MNDGGSAFPVNSANEANPGAYVADPGMSLRDYFAAKALSSFLSAISTVDDTAQILKDDARESNMKPSERLSRWAYMQADAMLEERNKEKK